MRPTRIKGLSERRRLPRLGKIHLGVRAMSAKGGEYPTKTDYFVCPQEVQAVYGQKPRDLDVILPVDDPEVIFPQAYKAYKAGVGLWCCGDGETAFRCAKDKDGEAIQEERECPCELLDAKKCKAVGNLMVILPRVSLGGVYQIDTGSINSILDINSGLDFIRERAGKLVNVPCVLTLRPRETTVDGKKSTIYTMNLVLANFETIKRLRGQMDEIRSLLSGGQPALPPASAETDLMPAAVVADRLAAGDGDFIDGELAPEGHEENDFLPPKKTPAPANDTPITATKPVTLKPTAKPPAASADFGF